MAIINNNIEQWNVRNDTSQTITLNVGKNTIPSIKPGKTVDLLRYASKEEISKAENLNKLIKSGNLTLAKLDDSNISEKVLSTEKDELETVKEELETAISISEEEAKIQGNSLTITPSDNLQDKYDWLKSSNRNSSMGVVSSSNRRYLWLSPGTYTDNLDVGTKYVHLRVMEGVVLSGTVTHTGWYGTAFGDASGDSFANAKNIDLPEALLEFCDTDADQLLYVRQTVNINFTDMIPAFGQCDNDSLSGYDGQLFRIEDLILADNPGANSGNALYRHNRGNIRNMVFVDPILLSSSPNAGSEGKSYAGIIVSQNIYGGVVRNCHVINGTINHTHTQSGNMLVGMIVGSNHGTIVGCTASGTISYDATDGTSGIIGGLVGYQTGGTGGSEVGSITGSRSRVNILSKSGVCNTKNQYIGGICGQTVITGTNNVITDCHFDGQIIIDNYSTAGEVASTMIVGGGVGRINSGVISKCSAKGMISIRYDSDASSWDKLQLGGFGGYTNTSEVVQECFSNAEIRVDASDLTVSEIGGFIGYNKGDTSDCYCMGSFYDLDAGSTALTFGECGGFVGQNDAVATMEHCYAVMDAYTQGAGISHGFIATANGTIEDCYWDSDTSGLAAGASAGDYDDKTTAEMVANSTFDESSANWDLNSGGVWKQADAVDYPKLSWE